MNTTAFTTSKETFCTFSLENLFFGVAVHEVQEVLRHQAMTRVPLAPDRIRGLMNLRGQIVTALDLRTRLNLKRSNDHEHSMNVVIRTNDGVVSLLVDSIGDVVEADREEFEPLPGTLQGIPRQLIKGTYKMQDKLLLILDLENALSYE